MAGYQKSRGPTGAKTYYNTGSFGSPVWALILNMRDETVDGSVNTIDVSVRDFDDDLSAPAGKSRTATFQLVKDRTLASYLALESAYDNETPIEVLALDGPIGTTGSRGTRATCMVSKFTENRAYKEIQLVDVELKPTLTSNGPPTRFVA